MADRSFTTAPDEDCYIANTLTATVVLDATVEHVEERQVGRAALHTDLAAMMTCHGEQACWTAGHLAQ